MNKPINHDAYRDRLLACAEVVLADVDGWGGEGSAMVRIARRTVERYAKPVPDSKVDVPQEAGLQVATRGRGGDQVPSARSGTSGF